MSTANDGGIRQRIISKLSVKVCSLGLRLIILSSGAEIQVSNLTENSSWITAAAGNESSSLDILLSLSPVKAE